MNTITMSFEQYVDLFVKAHGEVCKRSEAAKILNCSARKINSMLEDGRLDWACEGTRVDVRSILRFKTAPAKAEQEARIERIKMRNGTSYAV